MKRKKVKEDYYKIKCEEWFNDKNLIVYGLFAADKMYVPITFETLYTRERIKITNIHSWEEIYERKEEVLNGLKTLIKR